MHKFKDMVELKMYTLRDNSTLAYCKESGRLFACSFMNNSVNEVELVNQNTAFKPLNIDFKTFMQKR